MGQHRFGLMYSSQDNILVQCLECSDTSGESKTAEA